MVTPLKHIDSLIDYIPNTYRHTYRLHPSYISIHLEWWLSRCRGCPHGVMVKAMGCGILVREFVLQSRYYVHFRANTLGKGMNPLILPAMG